MPSIQINRFRLQILLLISLAIFFANSCDTSSDFEEKGPTKQESRRTLVDVNVISSDDKTTFEALFYYDVVGMVDGKVVSGVDKEVIKVTNATLGKLELKEITSANNKIVYTTEIPNEKKEYELTFSPNESMQAKHKLILDPIFIKQEKLRLERSKTHQIRLSREVSRAELPAVVEMINHTEKFVPANIEYLSKGLFFREGALRPFKDDKTRLRVRFESIPNERDENKSVRFFNYVIQREVELVE